MWFVFRNKSFLEIIMLGKFIRVIAQPVKASVVHAVGKTNLKNVFHSFDAEHSKISVKKKPLSLLVVFLEGTSWKFFIVNPPSTARNTNGKLL